MIKAVKHASIAVKDQDKALEFYTKKLGFEVVCDVPFGESQRWIELKIPGAQTQIVLFTPDGHENRIGTFSNIVFSCDDVKKTYEELSRKGVTFIMPPKEESWGTFALFKDPDDNSFCLSSSS
ncbi:MAG: VOC family protein [Chlamydiales bacterium]|nr:VOC family protein [Chlamydiales bacterium]